jgi:hypothetical protein
MMARWWHTLRHPFRWWLVTVWTPDGTTRVITRRRSYTAAVGDAMNAHADLAKRYGTGYADQCVFRVGRHAADQK